MLDGQHHKVDVPAHVGTALGGLPQLIMEEDLCYIVPQVPKQPNRSGHS